MAKRKNIIVENEEILEDDFIQDEVSEEVEDSLEEDLEDEDISEDDYEEDSEEEIEEETEAAATLRPNSRPASKMEMMAGVMDAMSKMSGGDMIKFFELSMSQAGEAAKDISGGQSAQNQASIAAKGKPVSEEDLQAVFGGDETLSEETKEKMSTLFEAAVNAKLSIEVARLEEEFESAFNESAEELANDLVENIDKYLDYVSTKWLEENKVAVEHTLRTELAEGFISELADLARRYNFNLPEGEDDIVEQLVSKVDSLEEALNESEDQKIELVNEIANLKKSSLVNEIAESLSPVHQKKFRTLAETVEYDGDDETLMKKLDYIKEGFFKQTTTKVDSKLITEEIAGEISEDGPSHTYTDPSVKSIHDYISRTVKK